MKIGFASDHRGYSLKEELIKALKDEYEIVDYGTYSTDSCDYPDFARALGHGIQNNEVSFGVAICGSGIGISVACNKVDGVYCAKVSNSEEAKYTRLDNNTNCVAFGEKMEFDEALNIVKTFITTPFSNEERHLRRVNKVKDIEANG